MSDPKDELRARFDAQADTDETAGETDTSVSDDTNNPNNSPNTGNSNNPNNSPNTGNSNNPNNSGSSSSSSGTSGSRNTEATTESTATSPGPSKDATATRHRRQVPMYLPDEKATALNELYERIDARSKIAGDGGIEKHADFMEQLVEFAVAHESELADQLGVES